MLFVSGHLSFSLPFGKSGEKSSIALEESIKISPKSTYYYIICTKLTTL